MQIEPSAIAPFIRSTAAPILVALLLLKYPPGEKLNVVLAAVDTPVVDGIEAGGGWAHAKLRTVISGSLHGLVISAFV